MGFTTERLYRLLIQGVSNCAIYMLDRDGLILNWNAGAEWIKGYRADQIGGRSFEVFSSSEDQAAGLPRHNLKTTLREGRLVTEGWRFRQKSSTVGSCVGVAMTSTEGTDMGTLLRQADTALYRAKEAGGSCVTVSSET